MATMFSVVALVLFLLTFPGQSHSCSRPSDYRPPSVAERTQKAPLVVTAQVVAKGPSKYGYNTTLNIVNVLKGTLNFSQIVADGFGQRATCLTEVEVNSTYIFFLGVNPFRALPELDQVAAAANSSETLHGVNEGLCCPDSAACKIMDFVCSGSTVTIPATICIALLAGVLCSYFGR